jgi:PEP-CTERM motif-containing protein
LLAFLALAGPAWAGSLQFNGSDSAGQGSLSFTPSVGNALTIGAGGGGNGALITDFINTFGTCGGDCSIVGGYLTLSTGGETGGLSGGGTFAYSFGSGGTIKIVGEIPMLGINTPTALFTASLGSGSLTGGGTVGSYTAGINLASIMLAPQVGLYNYNGANNDDISFSISPSCSTGGICTGTITQSDTSLQTIPEPATLSVLGVGLFAFGTGLRRRMAASEAV